MTANKLAVKTGDTVVVISGKDKGKQGKIQKAYPSTGKILVEGVAIVKKHQKPRGQGLPGGIVEKESAIPACKVMLVCPSCGKATRIAHAFVEKNGKSLKVRCCKKCGKTIEG